MADAVATTASPLSQEHTDSNLFLLIGKEDNLSEPNPALNDVHLVQGLLISTLILAYISCLGRLYVRFFVTKGPGWDDFVLVLAMAGNTTLSVSVMLGVNGNGMGEHFILFITDIDKLVSFVKHSYVMNASYPTATALIKIALLLQYMRLFDRGSRARQLTIFVLVFTTLWGISYAFLGWIPCIPVSGFWDFTTPDLDIVRYGFGSLNVDVFVGTYVSQTVSNMILDMVVLAIPVPLYFGPDLGLKSRASLFGLFLLGAVVNVISLFRLIAIIDSKAGTFPTFDPSWYGGPPIVLAALEVTLATICASLPVFWPMLQQNIGKILVTYEVTVTREESRRYSTFYGEESSTDLVLALKAPNEDIMAPDKAHDKGSAYVQWRVDPPQDIEAVDLDTYELKHFKRR